MDEDSHRRYCPLLARLLLSVIFVTGTISKFFDWSDNVSYVATKLPLPCAMLLAALLIELLGSLSLILGFRARIALRSCLCT